MYFSILPREAVHKLIEVEGFKKGGGGLTGGIGTGVKGAVVGA